MYAADTERRRITVGGKVRFIELHAVFAEGLEFIAEREGVSADSLIERVAADCGSRDARTLRRALECFAVSTMRAIVRDAEAEADGTTVGRAARPVPTVVIGDDPFSGRWQQRVPRTLHRRLAERAKREGVSLNALVVAILSEALGPAERERA